jgi:hypothetical protein
MNARLHEDKKKRFNILFSNVETLKPAIYSQAPVPDIRRRWQDKDPVGRLVAQILQRSVTYCLESYDFNGLLKRCNLDYLLPGFAVARVVYKPYLKGEGQDAEKIYEEVGTKYVPWEHVRHVALEDLRKRLVGSDGRRPHEGRGARPVRRQDRRGIELQPPRRR